MKELLKEIEQVKESIKQENDNYEQETIKYGLHSNGDRIVHQEKINRLKNYLKGLEVAKTMIEKEGK